MSASNEPGYHNGAEVEFFKRRLQEVSLELITFEERERKAIAENLHDGVTQLVALSLAKLKSKEVRALQNEHIVDVRAYLEAALQDIRSLTFEVSPPVLYDLGLEAALDWLVDDLNKKHGTSLEFINLLPNILYEKEQRRTIVLFRAIRELAINIVKHSKSTKGSIVLRKKAENLMVVVSDEGVGFHHGVKSHGFGLRSVRDRISSFGGTIRIQTEKGQGSTITLAMPGMASISRCKRLRSS